MGKIVSNLLMLLCVLSACIESERALLFAATALAFWANIRIDWNEGDGG